MLFLLVPSRSPTICGVIIRACWEWVQPEFLKTIFLQFLDDSFYEPNRPVWFYLTAEIIPKNSILQTLGLAVKSRHPTNLENESSVQSR